MQVRIEVPQLLRFYDDPNARAAFLHPPVDCKVHDTVLTMALQRLQNRAFSNIAIHATKKACDMLQFRLKSTWAFLKLSRHRLNSDVHAFKHEANGSTLWLSADEEVPTQIGYVYTLDSHLLQMDPTELYTTSIRFRCAGALADKHHWFYRFALPKAVEAPGTKPEAAVEPCSVHRFPFQAVKARWPITATQGLPEGDPYFRRHMNLEDVAPNFNTRFLSFAKRRLFIRTDKPREALTLGQQRYAEGQLGTPIVPFHFTKLQQKYVAFQRMITALGKRAWFILLKYRRGGFTTVEQCKSYMCASTRPRSQLVTLAHTLPSTQRIFRMVSTMHELDPQRLKAVGESKTQLELSNGSLFFIGTAGGRGFRGDTLQRVHGSEVAKWCEGPNQETLVDELTGGLFGAASHGEVVLESTPNGREWFYHKYVEAKAGQNDFTPIFLPWFIDPINRLWVFDAEEVQDTLQPDERGLMEKHELDLGQIAWRRQQQKLYGKLAIQEMPEDDVSCFLTSGVCFFDVELLLQWMEAHGSEEHGVVTHVPGGKLTTWCPPIAGHKYVAGVDTSEGTTDGDMNGVGIVDKETGEQVASLHGRFSPRELAIQAVELCISYNSALLAVERENHGHAVLQKVDELGYRRPHFRGGPLYYFQKANDLKKSKPGWSTNNVSRPLMLNNLADAMQDGSLKMNDRQFIDECLSFRRQANGKFEADSGAYDDSVMKWAIAWQMVSQRRPKPRITLIDSPAQPRVKKPKPDEGATVKVNLPRGTNGNGEHPNGNGSSE